MEGKRERERAGDSGRKIPPRRRKRGKGKMRK